MKLQTGLMSAAAIVLAASVAVAAPQGQSGSTTGSSGSGSMGQSSTAGSQSGSSQSGSSQSGSLAATDRKFIMDAASAGMLEVEAGRLASTRAQDPQLKSFAQKMVTEHTQNSQKLMSIAQARGVTPPNALDSKHKAMLDKLQRAQGSEFDQQFAQLMEKSHTQTVKDFEKARDQVQDPQLKSYIQATLPTLHEHHRMAQALPGAKGSKQAMSDDDTGAGRSTSSPSSSTSTSPNSTPSDTSSTTPPPTSPQ